MKRYISSALLIAMLASLTACGGEAGSEDTTVASDTTAAPVETALIDTLVDADYDGYEFRIFGETQTAGFGGDCFDAETETGDVIFDSVYKRNRAVEEKYNVKLSFSLVDQWDGDDLIKTYTLAGDNTYDLYTCTHIALGSMIVEKYFRDWKTVDAINFDRPWYVAKANETYSIGDATPLLFGDFMETNILRCWNFAFNKRLLEENKLEDPYTAVEEGRWTVDYLNNAIKDVSQDLNGDTEWTDADFYGLSTDSLATLDAFSRSLGLSAISKDKDNLPTLSFWSERVPEAYEAVYRLYYEGNSTYVDKNSVGHINKMFAVGKSIFATFRIDFLITDEMRNMEDNYGVLPYPKLNESDEGYGTYLSGTFSAQMIGITQPEENIERIGVITEALNAYGYEYVTPALYETTLKTKTSRDEKSIEMLDLILESREYSFDSCDESGFPLSPIKSIRSLLGSQKNKDISSYYASVKDSAQEWIDKMVEAYTSSEA